MKIDQGGYYGMKGYIYQYNKALNELLDKATSDDYVEIEQLEDLSDSTKLVQVKYKESKEFYPSSIRDPIKKLLNVMSDDDRDLYLYTYFSNIESKKIENISIQIDTDIIIPINYLDTILGKDSSEYTEEEKEKFVSKFRLRFTKQYDNELEQIILKICSNYNCDEDEAFIYYDSMISLLVSKVIENSPEDTEKRKCYRKEIDDIVNNSKLIFVQGYIEEIVGKEKYYSSIRKKLHFHNYPDNTEKIFIFDYSKGIEESLYIRLIKVLSEKFLKIKESGPIKKRKYQVDSGAPYIYIRNMPDEKLNTIKNILHTNDLYPIDGYPFKGSNFYADYLAQETKPDSIFKIKVFNNIDELNETICYFDKLFDVYVFSSNDNHNLKGQIGEVKNKVEGKFSYIKINRLDTNILNIFA